MALKLSRSPLAAAGSFPAVGGFHGKSMGAVSVAASQHTARPTFPWCSRWRTPYTATYDDKRKTIWKLQSVGESIAAVILEPVQGEAGVIIPPAGYLKAVRELCDEHRICLIFDEIQTGMGRTGAYFRCCEEDVTPDIMTYGKAFGGGIMPITGIIARPWLWVDELKDNPWLLGSPTFGGNPLACSAALGAINFMVKHDVPAMARDKG
jgi:putrescine aminotransferase